MEERNDLGQPLLGFRRRGARRVNPLVQIQTELRPIFAKNNTQVLFSGTDVHEAKKEALYQRLKDIEALSLADIRRIVNMPVSYVNHTASDSAYFVFCQISHWLNEYPKTLQVLTEHAFRLLRSGHFIFGGDSAELPSTILFFGIDQLLTAYPTFGRFRRWRFNSPTNAVVNKALERIAQELLDPRNNDAIDYKKGLWERLNKFTPAVIKRCLTREVQTENQGNLTLFNTFQAMDFSQYPNIKTAMGELKTAAFDEALNAKKLNVADINDVEILQILIKRLVGLIGASRFQGKYEDMMELCLVRLMELSDPKEGLNLDPELLKKCLGVINNYFRTSNRRAFLMTPDTSDRRQRVPKKLPIFYFIQCRLQNEPNVLANYPKINALTMDYKDAFNLEALPQSEEDFQGLEHSLVRLDVQELFETYLLKHSGSPVTTSLVNYYGANINAVRADGKRLLLWLIEENGKLHETRDYYNKYSNAIHVLLHEGVTVMQEDVDAAENINTKEGRHLLVRLQEKLPQQPLPVATAVPAVEGKGKEENEKVPVASFASALADVGAEAALKEVLGHDSPEAHVVNALVYKLSGEKLKFLAPGLKHKLCRCDLTDATKAKLNQHGFGAYLLSGIIYNDGDVSELEKCKASGVDVHEQDEYGHTGLYSAVQFGNDAALQWLVSQGVKPSEKDLAKAEILRSLEVKIDKEDSQTSAALLGKVVSGESGHPVHARRNSFGVTETVDVEVLKQSASAPK